MFSLLLLLLLSRSLGLLAQKFGISPLVGELLGGLILSPLLFNLLTSHSNLAIFAEFAIIVIMFHSGLHTDFSSFKTHRVTSIVVGAMGVAASFGLIFLLSYGVFHFNLETSLFLGAILSNSAIEISASVLRSTKNEKLRSIVVGASFIDDIMAVFVLGVVLSFVGSTPGVLGPIFGDLGEILTPTILFLITSLKVIAFLLITFYLLSLISQKILDRFAGKGFKVLLSIGFLFALGLGIFAKWVGLHEIIGVYLAGLILSRWGVLPDPMLTRGVAWMKFKETFTTMMESLFSPIFFGFVGVLLGSALTEVGGGPLLSMAVGVVLFTLFAFLGKITGCGLGARVKKIAPGGALMIGVVMGGRGALEFILIQSGLEKGLLNEEQFSVVIIVTLMTILLTPVFYRLVKNRVERDNDGEDILAQD